MSRTLETEPALAKWSRGVGRVTYDYNAALEAANGLHDEAVTTGKSFDEMQSLAKVLHNALGVLGDTEQALGTIPVVLPLLEEARVVDDPRDDRLVLGHRRHSVHRCEPPDRRIAPRRIGYEVWQPLVGSVDVTRFGNATGGNRLDALSFPLAEEPHRVQGERGSPRIVAEDLANAREEGSKPPLSLLGPVELHDHSRSSNDAALKLSDGKSHK